MGTWCKLISCYLGTWHLIDLVRIDFQLHYCYRLDRRGSHQQGIGGTRNDGCRDWVQWVIRRDIDSSHRRSDDDEMAILRVMKFGSAMSMLGSCSYRYRKGRVRRRDLMVDNLS